MNAAKKRKSTSDAADKAKSEAKKGKAKRKKQSKSADAAVSAAGSRKHKGAERRPAKTAAPSGQKNYANPIVTRERILEVLQKAGAPRTYEHLLRQFAYEGLPEETEALRRRLGAMCRDAQLIRNRKGGYVPVDASDLLAGRVSAHPDGFGFLVCDDEQDDVYLNATQMRQVLHGDKVVVCITGTDRRGRREGRITDVLERANSRIVGRLAIESGVSLIVPDNKRIHQDMIIAPEHLGTAADGDMVVAEILEQPSRRHPPVGRIVQVLGQHLKPGMEIDVAIHSHGIPYEWPNAVVRESSAWGDSVSEKDKQGRRDVRKVPLVTIDGEDARDFDDAVFCEKTDSGWKLLVAIADVSHYVESGSALDTEAKSRGTSVYFPGQVVPMLPEELSNGLCSLNPEVDRLCMLCSMTLSPDGTLKRTRFERAVMRSHARLTYTEVNAVLVEKDKVLRKKHKILLPHLENLSRLYKVLAKLRKRRGAIEFETTESKILFDDNRKIKEIAPVVRNDAHKIIEECMILANVATAAYLLKRKVAALYRVHHGPQADRLDDLRSFLSLRGLKLSGGDQPSAADFANLAKRAAKLPDAALIHTVMLRSMQAAVYQPANEGHFGLALDHYAHFTSPIRRYPDLLVHRAIGHLLAGGKASNYPISAGEMQQLGESCSVTERRAEEATRDVTNWLKCEYMLEHIGDEFNGVISSVTSFGLFVQLDQVFVEGLAHITSLGSDYYHFDQAAHTLTGERQGRVYRLGDPIRIRVAAVNLDERKIDFQAIEDEKKGRRGKKRPDKRTLKRKERQKNKRAKSSQEKEGSSQSSAAQPTSKPKPKSKSKKKNKVDKGKGSGKGSGKSRADRKAVAGSNKKGKQGR